MSDPHGDFIKSLGEGLEEYKDLPPQILKHPDKWFEERLGAFVGAGSSRTVFNAINNPNAVIKKTIGIYPGANLVELIIWNSVRGGRWEALFGEVVAVSETGQYLMMERLSDISTDELRKTPSYPEWLSDLQPKNIGKSESGQFKVRDYAMTKLDAALNSAGTHRHAWQGREPKK